MQLSLAKEFYNPDYDAEKVKCTEFLTQFTDPRQQEDPIHGKLKYMTLMQRVANKETDTINIEIDDLQDFFSTAKESAFVDRIKINTMRYINLFSSSIDANMPEPSVNFREDQLTTFEILMQQRKFNFKQSLQQIVGQGGQMPSDAKMMLPSELERTYQVFIVYGQQVKKTIQRMRDVRSNSIGGLVNVKGIVTRVSDVKPCIQVAVYACDVCGFEVYQIVNTREFTPKVECPSRKCETNQTKGQLIMQIKSSRFISFQEIKLQEPSEQVPIGHVPRTMKVIAKGGNTRRCSPGDIVTITGVYMPAPFHGFQQMRNGLAQDTYLEAFKITKDKQNFKESFLTDEALEKVTDFRGTCENDTQLYERLAQSICPEIFSMDEVKRALLLLMVGGVTKEMADGMKIRGNINVLLMGDPGVAKSQLLKHIATFAPRGIYTTGKGSSGVGLTAAVTRDSVTKELVLEGGALVLSDTGICCIDEFDKMDERDRTNIHEVMEQQTVSIAKAGITTSLNARTSILAAANPLYGRYNQKLKPHENINLPAALLSRFDLLFLLLDQVNELTDQALARHVVSVHKTLRAPVRDNIVVVDAEIMRAFIAKAQEFEPIIPLDLHNYIVAKYVEKRKLQREGLDEQSYMYVTPRTLLAIIRNAQAMAKLCFRDIVNQTDVDEAIKLMDFSIRSLRSMKAENNSSKSKIDREHKQNDKMSQVIKAVRDAMNEGNAQSMNLNEIVRRIQKNSFSSVRVDKEELLEVLNYYKKLQIVYVDQDENVVFL